MNGRTPWGELSSCSRAGHRKAVPFIPHAEPAEIGILQADDCGIDPDSKYEMGGDHSCRTRCQCPWDTKSFLTQHGSQQTQVERTNVGTYILVILHLTIFAVRAF